MRLQPCRGRRDWDDFLLHVFPENLAKSIAEGQILQVAVFGVFFGIALATAERVETSGRCFG